MLVQILINGLSVGSVYALIAIGYNLVYGILEQLNFAHGDVYTVGCFITFSGLLAGINPFLCILLGMAAGCLINLGVERFAYRPLRKKGANRIAPTISAVGIAYIMRNVVQLVWGPQTFMFDLGIFQKKNFVVGDTIIGTLQIYILLIAILLMLAITLVLKKTRIGQAITAISQSIPTAAMMGIKVNRIIALVYGLGAALGVVGGLLFCSYYEFIYMGIGFMFGTMKAWQATIIGGIGGLKGAVIGAIVMGLSETFISAYISSAYKDAVVWAIFIVFILIRPKGMFPAQIAEKV
ncbi:branched-chain amino acid ABC transporter permease [Anaerotruncus massiliensis (ex Togo et al. 2019)]|uniref:branched-chain amino acid ABC transporter permease n=1 Tax=Anaerotruncus massiliensis (ex Togo et al. 2019) TaxID=1673720 RepID=UPI0027B9E47E|nr:branched-chain amino acid ABC transporter permease [Anaerotruncus massiliensis (ex Togo et al. 2019)]